MQQGHLAHLGLVAMNYAVIPDFQKLLFTHQDKELQLLSYEHQPCLSLFSIYQLLDHYLYKVFYQTVASYY